VPAADTTALQTVIMADQEQAEIRLEFARLKQEHADLDAAINAMIATNCDALQIQRLKRRNWRLKIASACWKTK
jgi:hypothetical protein